jgi:hypothetical protein
VLKRVDSSQSGAGSDPKGKNMSVLKTIALGAALVAGTAAISTPASAVVTTFATYTQTSTTPSLRYQRNGSGARIRSTTGAAGNAFGSTDVRFSFLQAGLANVVNEVGAALTLDFIAPSGNPAQSAGGFLIQPGLAGTFSFTYNGETPLVVGNQTYVKGANLLSGTVTAASIAGANASSSGGFSASTSSGSVVTFTSDFLDFTNTVNRDVAISLTSIVPGLSRNNANTALNSFRASATGAFSSDPVPLVNGIVPEPATWGMMLLGFGLIGGALRRRAGNRHVAA